MMDPTYRVERHFGARGWLTALWMDWRALNKCTAIPCDCVWCASFQGALQAETDREEFHRRVFKESD